MITPQRLKKENIYDKSIFIAPNATVLGEVEIGNEVSIWFGAVMRGDSDTISIGQRSNVQDNAVLHADPGFPCIIGDDCIIGHSAIVHGAKLSNNVLVGMRATILNGAEIGEYSIIGAGALVTENMKIPPFSLVMGMPAKVIKPISEEQKIKIIKNAEAYVQLSRVYLEAYEK